MRFYVFQHEVDMEQITLQAQRSHKHEPLVKPARGAAEDAVQQQDAGDGERDIEHAFQEERKHAMLLLFQEYARQQRHQEHEPYHPYRSAVERLFLSDHLTHVDADEEDRHAAPEISRCPTA